MRSGRGRVVDARERGPIAEVPAPVAPQSIRVVWLIGGIALIISAILRR